MSQQLIFGDLAFSDDFVFAHTTDQKKIKFSKHERVLLLSFIARSGQLLTRSDLLDLVQQADTETYDRNIDYLISRLRRKLGDSANNPQYIATQYGEGYIWVAKPALPSLTTEQIYISVGPIYGLTHSHSIKESANSFAKNLVQSLKNNFSSDRRIELFTKSLSHESAEKQLLYTNSIYAIELNFFNINSTLTCTLVALNRKTGHIFDTLRYIFPESQQPSEMLSSINQLASTIKDKTWDSEIFRKKEQISLATDSLDVGLYKASRLFEQGKDNFVDVEHKLRQALQDKPEDHQTAILLARNLFMQITYSGNFVNLEAREQEIKSLIFDHIQYIQNDPLYLAAAAEKLYFLGHHELGENLAHKALELGSSFAACYKVIGGIKVYQGDILEGIAYYQHGQEIVDKSSIFSILLKSVECNAYSALGDKEKALEIVEYLENLTFFSFSKKEKIIAYINHRSDIPNALTQEMRTMIALIPQQEAFMYLKQFHYSLIKHFIHERHRINLLNGALSLFIDLHGDSVVPDEIKQSIPSWFSKN